MSLVEVAVEALEIGGIVGMPTDTVYGLGVDPWNESAVESLYEAKGRPDHKPISLLAASLEQAAEIVDLGSGRDAAQRYWPGGLTIVARPRVVIAGWVGDRLLRTVGIRVPDHQLVRSLLARSGPLAVTSANLSGQDEVLDDSAARAVFGERVAVYLPGDSPGGVASTVVDATGRHLRTLRAGPVSVD